MIDSNDSKNNNEDEISNGSVKDEMSNGNVKNESSKNTASNQVIYKDDADGNGREKMNALKKLEDEESRKAAEFMLALIFNF